MKTRRLTKQEVDAQPFRVWNAYVDLLAMEDYRDLAEEQRPAHLVFWYESEVQNGGHLQYFENRGTELLQETVNALGLLGAGCQQQILREAGEVLVSRTRPPIRTVPEFSAAALKAEFSAFSAAALNSGTVLIGGRVRDRKSTRLNSSHPSISYA